MPSDQSRDDGRRRDDESTDETLEWLHDRPRAEDRTYKERPPAALIHDAGRREAGQHDPATDRRCQAVLPQVKEPRPLPVQVANAYVNRALTAAEPDPVVAERFLRVAALQDPPARMARPSTALRVALGNRRRRRAPAIEAATGVPVIAPRD